jgi:hypothetical protein
MKRTSILLEYVYAFWLAMAIHMLTQHPYWNDIYVIERNLKIPPMTKSQSGGAVPLAKHNNRLEIFTPSIFSYEDFTSHCLNTSSLEQQSLKDGAQYTSVKTRTTLRKQLSLYISDRI